MDTRTCPECNGWKVVQHEAREPSPPDGRFETWLDDCQLCGGEGEIEVEPVTLDDLESE